MSFATSRLGDEHDHGGQMITGSSTRFVNGRPVVRIGDLAFCPRRGHGIVEVVMVLGGPDTDGKGTAHVGALLSCGARLITGSENVFQGFPMPAGSIAAIERDLGSLDDDPDSDDGLAVWPPVVGRAPTSDEIARSRANGSDPNAPTPPAQESDEQPPANAEEVPTDCAAITEQNINDSFRLSTNFTLGMLSSQAVISRAPVRAQQGLTVSQIACNLKAVAENVCEAVRARYGSLIITSGFRPGSGPSQHERGQAVDIQFPGISDAEYWERAQWVKDNIAYDQFILEYLGNRPWFHLSFSRSGNRRQVLTAAQAGRYLSGLHRYR